MLSTQTSALFSADFLASTHHYLNCCWMSTALRRQLSKTLYKWLDAFNWERWWNPAYCELEMPCNAKTARLCGSFLLLDKISWWSKAVYWNNDVRKLHNIKSTLGRRRLGSLVSTWDQATNAGRFADKQSMHQWKSTEWNKKDLTSNRENMRCFNELADREFQKAKSSMPQRTNDGHSRAAEYVQQSISSAILQSWNSL